MKKVLLGTSALAVAMSAGAALADGHAAPTLKFNGYYEVGFIGQSIENGNAANTQEDSQFFEDAELSWSISYPVESLGVSVGHKAEVQIANNTGLVTDESYIFIEGGFGRLDIGENDGSEDDFAVKSYFTGGAVGADDSSAVGSFTVGAGISGDAAKIKYTTPVLGGLVQGGVSYTPVNSTVTGSTTSTGSAVEDIIEVGAKLTTDLGGASLAVGAGFSTGDAKEDVAAVSTTGDYHVGAQVGIAGFTVGASYGKQTGDNGAPEPSQWQVGAQYATGPWTIGADYGVQDNDNASDDTKTYSIGGSYKLAESVTLAAGYNAVDASANNSDASKTGVSLKVAF